MNIKNGKKYWQRTLEMLRLDLVVWSTLEKIKKTQAFENSKHHMKQENIPKSKKVFKVLHMQ